MGRKCKASFEEKLNAVEDYLNVINTVEQISATLRISHYTVLQ